MTKYKIDPMTQQVIGELHSNGGAGELGKTNNQMAAMVKVSPLWGLVGTMVLHILKPYNNKTKKAEKKQQD